MYLFVYVKYFKMHHISCCCVEITDGIQGQRMYPAVFAQCKEIKENSNPAMKRFKTVDHYQDTLTVLPCATQYTDIQCI